MASPAKATKLCNSTLTLMQDYNKYINSAMMLLDGKAPNVAGAIKLMRIGDREITPQLEALIELMTKLQHQVASQRLTIFNQQTKITEQKDDIKRLQTTLSAITCDTYDTTEMENKAKDLKIGADDNNNATEVA